MKMILDLEKNLTLLLDQEDTDKDKKITVEDSGPKLFRAISIEGRTIDIAGTYYLSNFLQELVLAKSSGEMFVEIDFDKVCEKPVDRLNRMIKDHYWDGLTRRIDKTGLVSSIVDTKTNDNKYYLYVPSDDKAAVDYYTKVVAELVEPEIGLVNLPRRITPGFVFELNKKPGVVSLALQKNSNDQLEGVPFVVPGGRFNEMYGWDSYFESLGLIIDSRVDLAKAMAENLAYEIEYYGQILNANRTYYLTRSQPPFLTSLVKIVYANLPAGKAAKSWLTKMLNACIKEYDTVWLNNDRITRTTLSRYYGNGIGLPPETEENHFDTLLKPFAEKAGLSIRDYHRRYLEREIIEQEIEDFIMHDRSMRESGHDTSYRLYNVCAHLNTVDLNSLLYKYEVDIAEIIQKEFDGSYISDRNTLETSEHWLNLADQRKSVINELMWDEKSGFFFDFNFIKNERTGFESATAFYPLWANLASQKQADILVQKALPLLESAGGITSTSMISTGIISEERPQKQWDYPNGWAPHQILIWKGLKNYGYEKIAERLAYKWLYTITKNAIDYNGTIPEKYDVVSRSHKVFAEYGNVGTRFDYITKEGFGWMNASFKVGQKYLSNYLIDKLNQLKKPEELFGHTY